MRSMPVVGVISAYYLDIFCPANFTVKNKSSFHWVLFLAKAYMTLFMWSNMSLCTVITWCNVTVCLFNIHRVQYRNGLNTSMTYFTMVHSSCVVNSGQYSVYFGLWSHSRVDSRNQLARSSNSSVEFQCVFISIIGSTAMRNLAFWRSMNSFRRPGVSVINTAIILCYMKVSFGTFKISWNMYFLNHLCQTMSHGRHYIDCSIALTSMSLTLSDVYPLILSKLRITLIVIRWLGVAFYTKTAHECT